MHPTIRDLEGHTEQLRYRSIVLQLARGEPSGAGLALFGDDDELWGTLGAQLDACPFERERVATAKVIERFERTRSGWRRLASAALASALACPGCGPDDVSALDPVDTTGVGGSTDATTGFSVNTVTSASSTGTSEFEVSDNATTSSETTSATTGDVPDTEPPDVFNLRINWSKNPDKITQPGPVHVRVDASDASGIDRVEFSHDKDVSPFAIGTDYGDGSYGATVPINHQKFQGTTTFTVRAFDNAGNSAFVSVDVDVDLPPSGYTSWLTGTKHESAGEVWTDLEIDQNGELVLVGHFTAEGDVAQLVLQRLSPDASEIIASDFEQPTPGIDTHASAVALLDDGLVVLAHTPSQDMLLRYQADGTITQKRIASGVQYRDVAARDGVVVVAGNTGELHDTPTELKVWWYSPSLALQHGRGAVGDGPELNAATRVRFVSDSVIAAGFVEKEGERGGWIGRFTKTADELWQRTHYDGDDEVISDATTVEGGRIVTIGTAFVDAKPRVRLRRLTLAGEQPPGTGPHDIPHLPYDAPFQHGLRIARAPGANEFVVAARTCTVEPECEGSARRYRWTNLGPSPLWTDDDLGLPSPTTTITDLVEGPWGTTLLMYHCLVNFGQGHHDQSSLGLFHP